MGHARPRPKRLAEKLKQVRLALGLSQPEMHRRLGLEEEFPYTRISDYELDKNEPSLTTLLAYARVAGVHMEDLVDDELELPAKLPGNVRIEASNANLPLASEDTNRKILLWRYSIVWEKPCQLTQPGRSNANC